jgi:hypothetical protein
METPTVSQPSETPHEPAEPQLPSVPEQPTTPEAHPAYGTPPAGSYPPTQYGPTSYPPYPPYPPAPMPPRNNRGWIIGGVVAAFALIALIVVLIIALVASWVLGGVAGTMQSAVTSRTLQVQGTPTVVVDNTAGNVHIVTGAASSVTVQVTKHVRAAGSATVQSGFDSIVVNIAQQGNTITISSDFSSSWMGGMLRSRSVDYAITLPAGSSIQADVTAGNIDVSNTSGVLTLTSTAGNITTDHVTFASSSMLQSSAGNVIANGSLAPGASLQVKVSAGNATVQLPATTATHLTAEVNVGNLTITGFPVQVTSSGITGHEASGDTAPDAQGSLNVNVSTGNATITAR